MIKIDLSKIDKLKYHEVYVSRQYYNKDGDPYFRMVRFRKTKNKTISFKNLYRGEYRIVIFSKNGTTTISKTIA